MRSLDGDREAAWGAVHEALPPRWQVGPPTYDPGRRVWSIKARSGARGRGRQPVIVSGGGGDEVAALRDLDDRLRGVPKREGGRLDELWARARLAYLMGAEDRAKRNRGYPLTAIELEVVARAPLRRDPER